jgi:hypothetical protein
MTAHEICNGVHGIVHMLLQVCHPDFMGDMGHDICILLNGEIVEASDI